jgi:integrase
VDRVPLGELAGLQRDHVNLRRRTIAIDPDTGALHESKHRLWLGPPKTPASARTITLPRFLAGLLQMHLSATSGEFVFTSPRGHPLRRSDFDRRVFRPAVDGNPHKGTQPVRPGLTFHGLRHSHKTWLIADAIPEIAQARRLGHHLSNRLVETYSHVAPEIEHRLIRTLELRWRRANHTPRPPDNRPKPPRGAHHTHPARRTTPPRNTKQRQRGRTNVRTGRGARQRERNPGTQCQPTRC